MSVSCDSLRVPLCHLLDDTPLFLAPPCPPPASFLHLYLTFGISPKCFNSHAQRETFRFGSSSNRHCFFLSALLSVSLRQTHSLFAVFFFFFLFSCSSTRCGDNREARGRDAFRSDMSGQEGKPRALRTETGPSLLQKVKVSFSYLWFPSQTAGKSLARLVI